MARAPMPKQPQEGRQEYFVVDDNVREVAGQNLISRETGERSNKVKLTPAEAAFAIANGVVSEKDPGATQQARAAVEEAESRPEGEARAAPKPRR